MEGLAICWTMDTRWCCKISNPFHQFLWLLPLAANLGTIAGVVVERSNSHLDVNELFVILMVCYGFLALFELILLVKVTVSAGE